MGLQERKKIVEIILVAEDQESVSRAKAEIGIGVGVGRSLPFDSKDAAARTGSNCEFSEGLSAHHFGRTFNPLVTDFIEIKPRARHSAVYDTASRALQSRRRP